MANAMLSKLPAKYNDPLTQLTPLDTKLDRLARYFDLIELRHRAKFNELARLGNDLFIEGMQQKLASKLFAHIEGEKALIVALLGRSAGHV